MRPFLIAALMLGVALPAAAQFKPPVFEGAPAKLARTGFCPSLWTGFRCERHGVRGTVARTALDTVVVDLGQRYTGFLASVTTGQYPDSLVVWTADVENMRLKMLVGHRSRALQGLIGLGAGAFVGGAVGAFLEDVNKAFTCIGGCSEAIAQEPRHDKLIGAAVGGAFGLVVGALWSNEVWKRVKPGQ